MKNCPPVIGLGDCFSDRIFVCFYCNSNFRWHSVLFDRKFQFVVKWRIPAHRLLYGDHIVLFGHLVLFGAFVDEFRPKMSPHIAVRRTLVFVQDTADCCVIVLAEPRQQIQNVSTFGVVHNVATQVFDPVQYHQIGLEQCDFALQYLPPFVGVYPGAERPRCNSG